MIFLHGSHATSRWWEPFFEVLPDDIFGLAPDLRGCGESDKPSDGYHIEEQAEDLWAFVQGIGLNEFELVGHSSGGAIAIEFALNYQNVLNTLILVDSVPIEGVFTPLETLTLLSQMQTEQELLEQAISLLVSASADWDVPPYDYTKKKLFFQKLVHDAQKMAAPLVTATAESLGRWNRFSEGQHLTLPTLIIWGEQDQIIDREAMTRTLLAIPGANNLEVLRGVGHSPMIEAPLVLAERIINFITEDSIT